MTEQTISFEEFQAALAEKAATTKKASEMAEKFTEEKAATSDHPTRFELCRQSLASFVEKPSTQLLTILFIYFDIIGQCLLTGASPSPLWNIMFLFTTVFFTIELLLQALLFHVRFFSHWGCLVDTVLIVMRLGREYSSSFEMNQQHLVLLNFLKVWRVARLLNSFIAIEKQKCIALRQKLKSQIESTNGWKEQALLSEDVAKVCNEEVKTLREALKIAAHDVAAAMLGKVNPELSQSIENGYEGDDSNSVQVVMEDSSISTED